MLHLSLYPHEVVEIVSALETIISDYSHINNDADNVLRVIKQQLSVQVNSVLDA